jgi:hypothetical protein
MICYSFNSKTPESGHKKNIFLSMPEFRHIPIRYILMLPMLIILLLYSPLTGSAEKTPVYIYSQRLEYHVSLQKLFVTGDVNMTSEKLRLTAEDIEVDLASGEGLATGDVHIYLPQGSRLDTDLAEFNIQSGWWRIQGPDMWLEPSGYLGCEKGEKRDPSTIFLVKPKFTNCFGERPPWEIRGREGLLKPGKSIKIRHLSMWFKGVPVFYLPTAYLPIWHSGSTGLQPPEAGHSSRHGFFLKNLFTWPVKKNTEGRLFFDIFTRTGIGIGTGWKYSPGTESRGSEAKFYLLREDSPEKIHGKADLSVDIGRSDRKRGVVDVHYATERDFDRRFSFDRATRDQSIGESRAFVSIQKSRLGVASEWEHIRTLLDPNKSDLHQLPKIAGHFQFSPVVNTQTGLSPFYGLDLSASHMEWDLPEGQGSGEDYTFKPRLGLQTPINHWMNMNSILSTTQTYYHNEEFESEENWSHNYDLDLILTGPRVYRDYQRHRSRRKGGSDGIRHLVYPQVSYEYQTHEGTEPASVMNIDQETGEVENVRFGIVNRLWGKNNNDPIPFRSILDITASHTLHLKDNRQSLEIRVLTNPHANLRLNGRGYFFTKGSNGRDLDWNIALGNMDQGEVSIGWRQFINDTYAERLNTGRLLLTSPRWKGYQVSTSLIYDLKTENRIEETYAIFYQHQCWKANFAYIRQVDEDIVRANLNLIF